MMFATVAILLLQALAVQAGLFQKEMYQGDDIEALCAYKSVNLTSVSQLEHLNESRSRSSCTAYIQGAISELLKLIQHSKADLCSAKSADEMRHYVEVWHPTMFKDLPKPLWRLALAYGMQMSSRCKKNMVRALTEESRALLTDDDFKPFEQLILSDNSPIPQFLSSVSGPGEILMPADMAPIFDEKKSYISLERLRLLPAAESMIKQLKAICAYRFKPIYGALVTPLTKLANIGFDYKNECPKNQVECQKQTTEASQWSAIVFWCEALEKIRIVVDPSYEDQVDESGRKLFSVITMSPGDAASVATERVPSVAPLEYQPSRVALEQDLILDESNKRLAKAVKSLKTDRHEDEIMRDRLLSNGLTMIKNELKRGHFGLILGAIWNNLHKKKDGSPSLSMQIVKSLSELSEQQKASLDGSVS